MRPVAPLHPLAGGGGGLCGGVAGCGAHLGRHRRLGAIHTACIAGQGEQAKAFYLNRKQALYIITKADTPKAIETTIEVIERFDAYERG
jgi:hypothetical protein